VIILEGARHNFLPQNLLDVSQSGGLTKPPKWISNSELGPPAIEFSIAPSEDFWFSCRVLLDRGQRDYTLSAFAWAPSSDPIQLGASLSSGLETQVAYLALTSTPERLVRPLRFAEKSDQIEIRFFVTATPDHSSTLRISLPVLEEGLFATTPISLGEFRAQDSLSYERAGNFFDESIGTISFLFIPSWSAHELSEGISPHMLSCSNNDGSNAVDIFADAQAGGCLAVNVVAAGKSSLVRSDIFPRRDQLYMIALRWSVPYVELIINGYTVGSMSAVVPDKDQLGRQVYLGISARSDRLSAFGCFEQWAAWNRFLTDHQLRALAYELAPLRFPHFRFASLQAAYDTEHWPVIIVNFLLRYPSQFQQTPPRWFRREDGLAESDFRDDLNRTLGSLLDIQTIPEEHAESGRTDILFSSREAGVEKRVRVEYKIWGRNDYAEIPEKPLKYMRAGDRLGAVFMINPNKRKGIGDEYRRQVHSYSGGCLGLIDLPFGDNLADHFVSHHERPWGDVEILHVVMDLLQ
jgi:hypothetical protein